MRHRAILTLCAAATPVGAAPLVMIGGPMAGSLLPPSASDCG